MSMELHSRDLCIIKEEFLTNIPSVREHLSALVMQVKMISEGEVDLEELAWAMSYDDICEGITEENQQILIGAYKKVCKAFEKETGLQLFLTYVGDNECGTLKNGYAWEVGGMYTLSEGGKLLRDYVTDEISTNCS